MLFDLNIDIIELICFNLNIESLTNFIKTSKFTSKCLMDTFFKEYCYMLYDSVFWNKALQRSKIYHSLVWKYELYKIEKFQKMVLEIEGRRWDNYQFYKFWIYND